MPFLGNTSIERNYQPQHGSDCVKSRGWRRAEAGRRIWWPLPAVPFLRLCCRARPLIWALSLPPSSCTRPLGGSARPSREPCVRHCRCMRGTRWGQKMRAGATWCRGLQRQQGSYVRGAGTWERAGGAGEPRGWKGLILTEQGDGNRLRASWEVREGGSRVMRRSQCQRAGSVGGKRRAGALAMSRR